MTVLEISKAKLAQARKMEEYFNALSTNIQLSGTNIKVIAISSVEANEGKSTTASNLAMAFARSGYKTLLIDADIRNSVMSGSFKAREKVSGLTDYLSGTDTGTLGICKTTLPNLHLLLSGQVSPNPIGLLQSKIFDAMVETLRNHYDYIIIDTPPIGIVIDAAIIASKCDGTVLVTEAGRISRKAIRKAKEQLEQTEVPFLGVVLNKLDTQAERYGAYGNYGNYGNYGKKA